MDLEGISSTLLAVVSAAIAAAAAGVAVWRSILAGRQAQEAKMSRELSAVITLFNAHQAEDASRIRRLIRHGTLTDRLDDPEIRFELRHYVNHLNFIATVRSRQLLGDELVTDLFYEAAKACWEGCAKAFIREVREGGNEDYARELQAWVGPPTRDAARGQMARNGVSRSPWRWMSKPSPSPTATATSRPRSTGSAIEASSGSAALASASSGK
jgi:hypothetical protein